MRNVDLWRSAMNIEDRQEQWEGEEPGDEDWERGEAQAQASYADLAAYFKRHPEGRPGAPTGPEYDDEHEFDDEPF